MGGREVKHRSRREPAGVRVGASLLEGGATGASEPHGEPPAEGGTSRPEGQSWGPSEQGAPAESGRLSGRGRERGEPGGPIEPAGEGPPPVDTPWLPPPLSGSNTESRAARGQRTQGSHEEESPAGRDTSSKRSRKT